ncbi:hypothetical protein ACM61V_14810 [Sphingomonas sp. TX0543]|uniref:hypothetical protein n=1 Tax=unclassified Sphingomonas TaxID=196159 RepID=UPI0010F7F33E|nr:hypothetical protein [Sphingomonas sp. 3P27F8]
MTKAAHEIALRDLQKERDYWRRRAAQHGQLAEKADSPASIALHLDLQRLYDAHADSFTVVQGD